ncbi:MAG TPA: 5-oxoprolinase/urea amidolyase family protein [Rubrivivax sp.]|nr:5-oxoprolinase/urea amidolyase family protein [Rubrivivax sp.]
MRILPASDQALLLELQDLRETLALFQAWQREPLAGVDEIVPAARTLLVAYRPSAVSAGRVAAHAQQLHRALARQTAGGPGATGRLVQIPVRYDGEDLEVVAELLGIGVAELIERHTGGEYQAAFAGFAPGFVYLAGGHPSFQIPRRPAPRTRVPAGSVALAGEFSAVYPADSPGGWQLLGVTPCRMWDLRRAEPALVQPGLRVRFLDMARPGVSVSLPAAAAAPVVPEPGPGVGLEADLELDALQVEAAGLQTLVQDLGRQGKTGMGVSASGALDRGALRQANRIVGNPSGTPALENLLGGLRLRCRGRAVVAVTGAEAPLALTTAAGQRLPACIGQPLALEDGDVLAIGAPAAGVRCCLAARGGFAVEPVLGSCATDTLAQIGPAPLAAGMAIAVGTAVPRERLGAVLPELAPPPRLPAADSVVTLDVVLGPRTDWFTPDALATLLTQPWRVTPQSDRVGMRLAGDLPLARSRPGELPSEGTVVGALQVPANGQPVLFLADHPLTGGYPVIAAVASHHLDLAAQIPVGARLRFRAIRPFGVVDVSAHVSTEEGSA